MATAFPEPPHLLLRSFYFGAGASAARGDGDGTMAAGGAPLDRGSNARVIILRVACRTWYGAPRQALLLSEIIYRGMV